MRSIVLFWTFVCILLSAFDNSTAAHNFNFVNKCSFTVWPGLMVNSANRDLPLGGGFELLSGKSFNFSMADGWAGMIWGRTNCDGSGRCETGSCGDKIQCKGDVPSPTTPTTVAHFSLDGFNKQDFYEVSLINGFNLPILIRPIAGTFLHTTHEHSDCLNAGCYSDLNENCPTELAVKSATGSTVACKSGCQEFNSDEFCCRNSFGRPFNCKPEGWKTNYVNVFKASCSEAVNYLFDTSVATFHCISNETVKTSYTVQFCS